MITKDKFIAFVDIVGFSAMLKVEEQNGRDLSRPLQLVKLLGSSEEPFFASLCPCSKWATPDIDFKMTQISDCVVVSAEASPAGVINLVHYCRSTAMKLLLKGALCRGYITRGNIFHEDHQFIGTGFVQAVENEKVVRFMRVHAEEKGTPFIQVDGAVSNYVKNESDACVRKMFDRMVRSDGTYTAIYPFGVMSTVPTSVVGPDFNPRFWKESLRKSLGYRRQELDVFEEAERVAPDEDARRKVRHYKRGFEEIIERLLAREVELDRMIATNVIPFGGIW